MSCKTRYLPWKRLGWILAVAALAGAGTAQANTIMFELTDFTGDNAAIDITLNDSINPSAITVTTAVDSSATGNIGDIRGIFFNLINDPGLTLGDISGADITDKETNTSNTGGGNVVNPAGPFDFGLEIGTPGIGSDDIQSTTFLIDDVGGLLTLADFGTFAGRLTSVGPAGSTRSGSSKLTGDPGEPGVSVPTPSAFLLFASAIGITGLLIGMRRRRNHSPA